MEIGIDVSVIESVAVLSQANYATTCLGHGEVWTHTREDLKMQQFGWRCTNKESSYSNKTLTGNWNEERCNYDKALQNIPLPSQVAYEYFTSEVGNLWPTGRMQSTKTFYPARDLLLSSSPRPFSCFNDRCVAINRRNNSHLIFWSSPSIRPKKCLNFW